MPAMPDNASPAPNRFRFAKVFFILVAVDLVSKLLAYYAIPDNPSNISSPIAYSVIINDTGSNAALDYYQIGNDLTIVLASLCIGLLGLYVILIQKSPLPTMRKIVFGVMIYFAFSVIIGLLQDVKGFMIQSKYLLGIIKLIGPLFFYGTLYYFTKAGDFKFAWTLMVAGGAGNLLSYFYPPFGVVDFVSMNMPGMGNVVFNLADVYSSAATATIGIVLIIRFATYIIGRLRSRRRPAAQ